MSNAIETKNWNNEIAAYFVATVLGKKASNITDFEEVKTDVIEDMQKQRAQELALKEAQQLLSQRLDTETLEELVKKYAPPDGTSVKDREVKESNLFVLSPSSDYVSGMGNCRNAMFAAFNMELNAVDGPF